MATSPSHEITTLSMWSSDVLHQGTIEMLWLQPRVQCLDPKQAA